MELEMKNNNKTYRIFVCREETTTPNEKEEYAINKTVSIIKEIISSNYEEVKESFSELSEELFSNDKNILCVILDEVRQDNKSRTVERRYRPRTIEEINKFVGLEGISIGYDYYYIQSTTFLEEVDNEDEEDKAGFNCFYMDGEDVDFRFFTFEELVNRTDVCFCDTKIV